MQQSTDLERLRSKVKGYIDSHQYETASFWADKICSLSSGDVNDTYTYAETLYLTEQYHRAAHLIKNRQLHTNNAAFRYLAAKCYYESKDYQEALTILDVENNNAKPHGRRYKDMHDGKGGHHGPIPIENIQSCVQLLQGRIYEAIDNRDLAANCFREALKLDVYCYEAFDAIVNHHMLSAQEEKDLLESLPFSTQCPEDELELVQFLYENKLKKYNKPSEFSVPSSLSHLDDNMDIMVNLAERHYYNCEFRECFNITSVVLERDPYNSQCLPIHVSVLVELKKKNKLFYLAHKLVEIYPTKPVAWFAVGCYYLLIGKNEPARRFFRKATTLDRVYGPAWLAFGHSFATEKEHDQAMAAYFTASQLMKGCHLPMLYIGLEYGLTNNPKLAERFFTQAQTIAPEDPFALHEMGVVAFKNEDFESALSYFMDALEKVQSISDECVADKWESLLNNIGHTLRKLKRYEEALDYHQKALVLSPQNASIYSAMGFIHTLTGNVDAAVEFFHKALGIRREDTFSTTMLGQVIEELMKKMTPCDGVPDTLPDFQYEGKLNSSLLTIAELNETDLENTTDESQLMMHDDSVVTSSSSMMLLEEVDMEGND